jgi:hypothetical protein
MKFFAASSLAIGIGAMTHVFWDSFTHRDRWGTNFFPRLNENLLTTWGHGTPGYKVLQYGSTLVLLPSMALLLILWIYHRRPEPLGGPPDLPRPWRVAIYLVAFAIPAIVTLIIWTQDRRPPYTKLGESITTSGLALATYLLAYCVAYQSHRLGR